MLYDDHRDGWHKCRHQTKYCDGEHAEVDSRQTKKCEATHAQDQNNRKARNTKKKLEITIY